MTEKSLQFQNNTQKIVIALITGTDRLSLESVSFGLMDSAPHTCCVQYVVQANDEHDNGVEIQRTVTIPTDSIFPETETTQFEMDDCCLPCSIKNNLHQFIRDELIEYCNSNRVHHVVVALPIGVEATPIQEHLQEIIQIEESMQHIAISDIAHVVQCETFEENLVNDDHWCLCTNDNGDALCDDRSVGVVITRLLREAYHVLKVNNHATAENNINTKHDQATTDRIIEALRAHESRIHDDAYQVAFQEFIRN